jgi:predicted nucleotidyltransferase component of viral defense system
MNEHQNQSTKDRLKNVARASGKDFNFVSIQFMQERFLARLEKSTFREHLILKGALLLLAYKIPVVRPSKDIDFLGIKTSNETDDVRSVIRQIARIDLKDGVSFDEEDIDITDIKGQSEYPGLRIKIPAMVGGDRHRLQIDR